MKTVAGYAGAALVLLALLVGLCWPWLDGAGRRGVLLAAAIAWPVQVVAFGLLLRHRGRTTRFLVVWAGGTLVRLGVVFAAALALTRFRGTVALAPALLALAGFFFGLLLLEPVFFRRGTTEAAGFGHDSDGT